MDRQSILQELEEALQRGDIDTHEVQAVLGRFSPLADNGQAQIGHDETEPQQISNPSSQDKDTKHVLSVTEVMFYAAGVITYAALFTLSTQLFGDTGGLAGGILFLIAGVGAWGLVIALGNQDKPRNNDTFEGGVNATSLFGSLSLITSVSMLTDQLNVSLALDGRTSLLVIAIALVLTSALHAWYAFISKRTFVLLIGLLLLVSAFLATMMALLYEVTSPSVWATVVIVASLSLTRITRLINPLYVHRDINTSFDTLAAVVAFSAMYIASFAASDGGVWLILIIFAIFGQFYLSIQQQSKKALGVASFFLIVTIITIAFRYFSGFNVTFALLISAFGVLGSAIIASSINKKYIK